VVYRLVALEWQVTGAGWSQVQVFRDSGDGSHRLVGWTVEDGLLTVNSNITADCIYKRKSDDFHKMTDEEGQQWGQPQLHCYATLVLLSAALQSCSVQHADSKPLSAVRMCARCRLRLLQEDRVET